MDKMNYLELRDLYKKEYREEIYPRLKQQAREAHARIKEGKGLLDVTSTLDKEDTFGRHHTTSDEWYHKEFNEELFEK